MNLVLCGMMGAGKTTVGAKIAQMAGWNCVDTDVLIAEKYGEISGIFKTHGEAYFRGLETEIVKELAGQDHLVVATGGGLVLKAENVALLKQSGKIIFLRAEMDTLLQRLKADTTRPLLQTEEPLPTRLNRLLCERTPVYERAADYIVDVDGKGPEEIAKEIMSLIQ